MMFKRAVTFLLAGVSTAAAQANTARVQVRDGQGLPVGFALVSLVGGSMQVATDSGVATLRVKATDSLNLQVRRIGYREHFGWVRRGPDGGYTVTVPALAVALTAVEITERANTPLARTGFYDRASRVQRGAILGDFLTPEQLDARGQSSITRMIEGSRYARATGIPGGRNGRRFLVITGRGGCAMTIVLDGQRMTGVAGENFQGDAPSSINGNGTAPIRGSEGVPLDDLIDGRSVMAIEIYPSTANAPAELQTLGGRGSCGIVAIWTGPRQ